MKRAFLTFTSVIAVALMVVWPAHGQKQQSGTSSDSFLKQAIEMNQAEVEVSKLAQNKAQDPKVKDYAEMMVRDHSQALDKLRSTAGENEGQIQMSSQHQQLYDKLARLSGSQFDKEYMNAMVRDHKQAVQMFQREAGSTGTSGTARQKPG